MDTSREDVGIAIRSALLRKGVQQIFSLFVLVIFSVLLMFFDKIELKQIDYFRSIVKDVIFRTSAIVSMPIKSLGNLSKYTKEHFGLFDKYILLKDENARLKNDYRKIDFLELENNQLKNLLAAQVESSESLISARILIDKQSPYLNSFIINAGSNKGIKNGMTVLSENNFIGRIVDVNFFSSRVLLISDLNSKVATITEPSGTHAILSGHGTNLPTLDYLPKDNLIQAGDKVYTSGTEGIFSPGIPIGTVKIVNNEPSVLLFSDLSQITFINIKLKELGDK